MNFLKEIKRFIRKFKKIDNTNLKISDYVVIREVLNYGWHRASKHKTPISQYAKDIDRVRIKLGIINKSKLPT